jgi:hypothetical protein
MYCGLNCFGYNDFSLLIECFGLETVNYFVAIEDSLLGISPASGYYYKPTLRNSLSVPSSWVGRNDARSAKPSQSSNWGAETCAKRKSTSPCLLAIPASDRKAGLNNRHLNSNRGMRLR